MNAGLCLESGEFVPAEQLNALPIDVAVPDKPSPFDVPTMSHVARRKLGALVADGHEVCGVMIQRVTAEGVQRGAVSAGGMVIWWRTEQAQGVPDGWKLVPKEPTPEMVGTWKSVDQQEKTSALYKAMLASAPPAPQASKCAQCQKEYKPGTTVAGCPKCAPGVKVSEAEFQKPIKQQASVVQQEPVAWKHDCAALLTNDVELWIDACPHCGKPRIQPAQQEPVAWICEEQTIGPNYGKKRLTFSKYYSDNPLHYRHTPLYTHPAQQAKPQTMTAMVDAAMVEMRNITPPLRRSECERLIRAALEGGQP